MEVNSGAVEDPKSKGSMVMSRLGAVVEVGFGVDTSVAIASFVAFSVRSSTECVPEAAVAAETEVEGSCCCGCFSGSGEGGTTF